MFNQPIVTAEKYIQYKRDNGYIKHFKTPKIVLICYQQSSLKYLLEKNPDATASESFSDLYLLKRGEVGILGGWGFGASALAGYLEQLIVLGVKKFIAIGTAGALMHQYAIGDFILPSKALAEDGVSHLYLPKKEKFAEAQESMLLAWESFRNSNQLGHFHNTYSWSFPAIFRETPKDIKRVAKLGCGVVEMEAATLYAIGQLKNVSTLSLFVVSDSISLTEWIPHIKGPVVRNNLHLLADWSLEFCKMI